MNVFSYEKMNFNHKFNHHNDIIDYTQMYHHNTNYKCKSCDENNDINMFKEVKYSVCMGNGHEEAKKAAYFVTTNIDDNGIYNALKHFEVI